MKCANTCAHREQYLVMAVAFHAFAIHSLIHFAAESREFWGGLQFIT